ncbi:MAG: hypothetical protein GX589_08520 [Deltaproteobacteria bacterium]|nr:hypothetical protein [Deltaproteobacteria bacterium]
MSQVVLNISRIGCSDVIQLVSGSYIRSRLRVPTREVAVLGLVLCLLQVMDGILTAAGVNMFGVSAEGNVLLRYLMEQIGLIPALAAAKCAAIAATVTLCMLATQVSWISRALKGVIAIYLLAAIVPWTFILVSGN